VWFGAALPMIQLINQANAGSEPDFCLYILDGHQLTNSLNSSQLD
jgi:hypothetical protein